MEPIGRIAVTCLALMVASSACTEGDDGAPRTDRRAYPCALDIARPRSGDVPVAVDGLAPDDVWVVGAHYEGGAGVPYARRWDGETWDSAPVEVVEDANAGFHDVAVVSADDAWAVGSLRAEEPMVQRWDGSAWQNVTLPPTGSAAAELFGVTAAAPDAVWAVGRALHGLRWRALALRWDGGSWGVQDVPTFAGTDAALRGVDANHPGDAWAVGWSVSTGGRYRTLAVHFDGTEWRRVPTPNPGRGDHLLSSVVAPAPDEAWAVGWSIPPDGRDRPLVLRWDGRRWRREILPDIAGRAQLMDVAASGARFVWAAGRATDPSGTFVGLLLLRNGNSWVRVGDIDVGAEDDTLSGVAVTDRSPWGVGTSVDAEGRYTSLVVSGC